MWLILIMITKIKKKIRFIAGIRCKHMFSLDEPKIQAHQSNKYCVDFFFKLNLI